MNSNKGNIMAKIIFNCPYYESFFGNCNLYERLAPNYDHDDNEWVPCRCSSIDDCDYKKGKRNVRRK